MEQKMTKLNYVRFCCSGALAGMAFFGVLAPLFGVENDQARQAISGAIGAGIVAIWLKVANIA